MNNANLIALSALYKAALCGPVKILIMSTKRELLEEIFDKFEEESNTNKLLGQLMFRVTKNPFKASFTIGSEIQGIFVNPISAMKGLTADVLFICNKGYFSAEQLEALIPIKKGDRTRPKVEVFE